MSALGGGGNAINKAKTAVANAESLTQEQQEIDFGRSLLYNIRQRRIATSQLQTANWSDDFVTSSAQGAQANIDSALAGEMGYAYKTAERQQKVSDYYASAQRWAKKAEKNNRVAGYVGEAIGAVATVVGAAVGTFIAPGIGTAAGASAGAAIGTGLTAALGGKSAAVKGSIKGDIEGGMLAMTFGSAAGAGAGVTESAGAGAGVTESAGYTATASVDGAVVASETAVTEGAGKTFLASAIDFAKEKAIDYGVNQMSKIITEDSQKDTERYIYGSQRSVAFKNTFQTPSTPSDEYLRQRFGFFI